MFPGEARVVVQFSCLWKLFVCQLYYPDFISMTPINQTWLMQVVADAIFGLKKLHHYRS